MILVFDLDGTLLDTFSLIEETYKEVLDTLVPDFVYDDALIKSFFGPPLEDSFRKVTSDKAFQQELIKFYKERNVVNHYKYLKIFPKVKEGLEKLKTKGYKMAVFSNKAHEMIMLGLRLKEIDQYFEIVLGLEDVVNPKPNPEGFEKIKAFYKEDRLVMIGDTKFDMVVAKNANVPSIGVTWALTTKKELIEFGADYVIDDFDEIFKILEELC